ncbi:unnamed protein product [Sympodiomycopsis kandeliae]
MPRDKASSSSSGSKLKLPTSQPIDTSSSSSQGSKASNASQNSSGRVSGSASKSPQSQMGKSTPQLSRAPSDKGKSPSTNILQTESSTSSEKSDRVTGDPQGNLLTTSSSHPHPATLTDEPGFHTTSSQESGQSSFSPFLATTNSVPAPLTFLPPLPPHSLASPSPIPSSRTPPGYDQLSPDPASLSSNGNSSPLRTGTSGSSGADNHPIPYPSRAASLPGTSHHNQNSHHPAGGQQHSGNSRHRGSQTPTYNTSHLSANNVNTTRFGVPNLNFSPGMQPLLRNGSQMHSQVAAQQMANGSMMTGNFGLPGSASIGNHQLSMQQQLGMPHERFVAELTNCIIAFLSPILPTEEEYRIKEATRRQLERLAGKVIPGARLLAFGSMANGFALKNSDMDLCCLTAESSAEAAKGPPASELVERMAQILRQETDFTVQALPKARIPIIKISRAKSAERPYELACDIGFENRLALENTRLLLSYAMVDPPRLRTLVLFLKVWTKRRKLNSPYMGTLSSYGYTLLVLFFLMHCKRPSVLPNLQRIPPSRPLQQDEIEVNGHNTYFFDDVNALKKDWQTQNSENVAELLIDFFRYFAKDFAYSRDVISIKTEGGLLAKDGATWTGELCIEDPFQSGYNVSRTVTKDGLYTIRGEFMRATRILQNRHQRVTTVLTELCEEREDFVARAPDTPPLRNKYANSAMYSQLSAEGRSHDGPRRSSNLTPSGFGGSFAFEEMARGLGRQRGQMAYPTTAMLAPLSQNGGLSPRPRHSGLRGTRDLSTPGRVNNRSSATVPSSARSDDGNGSPVYDNNARAVHASARTSPTFAPAVPHDLPESNDVGEAWAFGSEISFGSERFRLHPHPSKGRSMQQSTGGQALDVGEGEATFGSSASVADETKESNVPNHRSSRAFSDGINRSKSLPRRVETSGPPPTLPLTADSGFSVQAAMAGLTVQDPSVGDGVEQGNSSGRLSPTASSDAPSQYGIESTMAPTQEYTAAWAEKQLRQGHQYDDDRRPSQGMESQDSLSLRDRANSKISGTPDYAVEEMGADGSGSELDHSEKLSDGVLDELSRISQIESEGRGRHSRNSSYAEAKLGFGQGIVPCLREPEGK